MLNTITKAGAALAIIGGLGFASVSAQAAESYKLDPSHTSVIFIVNHLGFSHFQGRFGGVSGEMNIDREHPANSTADIAIDLSKIDTGVAALDKHLQSADFFDVAKYPTATFKSTKVEMKGEKTASITGNLTLHGQTKPVVFTVDLIGDGVHPVTKNQTMGFSASATVTRSEFGVDYLVPGVGDDVTLQISSEFIEAK